MCSLPKNKEDDRLSLNLVGVDENEDRAATNQEELTVHHGHSCRSRMLISRSKFEKN